MNDPLVLARDSILAPAGLAEADLDRLMGLLMGASLDAADIYFQSSRLESWVLEDGIIKEGSFSIEQGAGLRAVSGERTGFAYSDDSSSRPWPRRPRPPGRSPAPARAPLSGSAMSPRPGGCTTHRPVGAYPRRPRSTCCAGWTRRRGAGTRGSAR